MPSYQVHQSEISCKIQKDIQSATVFKAIQGYRDLKIVTLGNVKFHFSGKVKLSNWAKS